ncbi:MAG: hypothetical protein CL927_13410, partial [Deltaproteobacteria bacterium]|nr:hypothetical protein [Deltaproteobacteria bacterium]
MVRGFRLVPLLGVQPASDRCWCGPLRAASAPDRPDHPRASSPRACARRTARDVFGAPSRAGGGL